MARDQNSYLTSRLRGFGSTIFAEMTALADDKAAINLGQGFPDYDGPSAVLDAAVDAIRSGQNQYPPGPGIADLRLAVAEHQRRFYGLSYEPDGEVLITAGATEALAGAVLGILEAGDEVVLLEPMYDSYQACIALAGAVTRPVTLRPPAYGLDLEALRAAVTLRTRMILLNTLTTPPERCSSVRSCRASPIWRWNTISSWFPTRCTNIWCTTAPSTCPSRRCPG